MVTQEDGRDAGDDTSPTPGKSDSPRSDSSLTSHGELDVLILASEVTK